MINFFELMDRATRKVGQVFLRNPGDTVNVGDAANPVRTDPTGVTTQPVSGTVTSNQGTALPQTGAGWPVQSYGMTDTLFASGTVSVPLAGAAIATMTNPPAGTYRVDVFATNTVDNANMEFRKGAVVQFGSFGSGLNSTSFIVLNMRITLDGATNLSINATAGGGVSSIYQAQIFATRIF